MTNTTTTKILGIHFLEIDRKDKQSMYHSWRFKTEELPGHI